MYLISMQKHNEFTKCVFYKPINRLFMGACRKISRGKGSSVFIYRHTLPPAPFTFFYSCLLPIFAFSRPARACPALSD